MRTDRLHPARELEPEQLEGCAFAFAVDVTQFAMGIRDALPAPVLDGLVAAAVKTGAEVANAYENPSRHHALAHLNSARRAVYETLYWLRLATAAGAVDTEAGEALLKRAGELHGWLTTTCTRRHKQVES